MKKNIKIVRLTTGEDLIGEVQEGSGIVNIKKPYIIYPTSQPCSGAPLEQEVRHQEGEPDPGNAYHRMKGKYPCENVKHP